MQSHHVDQLVSFLSEKLLLHRGDINFTHNAIFCENNIYRALVVDQTFGDDVSRSFFDFNTAHVTLVGVRRLEIFVVEHSIEVKEFRADYVSIFFKYVSLECLLKVWICRD